MEENNKYYTPEIEEFHVGFEYERCDGGYEYLKEVFPRAVLLNTFYKHPERFLPYFRVKHLDRDDIESLGYKHIFEDERRMNFSKGVKEIMLQKEDSFVLIAKDIEERDVSFKGTIKNISELKRILKQIGI